MPDFEKEDIMNLMLTEAEMTAVKNGTPVRGAVAELGEDVVIVRASDYVKFTDWLRDEQDDRRVRDAWLKSSSLARAKLLETEP